MPLCQANLLNLLVQFLGDSLGFSVCTIKSSANKYNFTSPPPNLCVFVFLLCLISLPTISSTILKWKWWKWTSLCSTLRENLCFSLKSVLLVVGFLYKAFSVWGHFLLFLVCWDIYLFIFKSWENFGFCQMYFFSIDMVMWMLFLFY